MKAQAYFDKEPTIRIFIRGLWAADLPLNPDDLTNSGADRALRRMRLRRVGAWKVTEWGRQAKVRFAEVAP